MVELVVVLGIIAVMLGIFLPASFRVREAARETVCKNNLRQLNLGLLQQLDAGGLPPSNPENNVGGWAIELLPFLEQTNLESAIASNVPLNQLDPKFHERPRVYECPTQLNNRPVSEGAIESTHYILIAPPVFGNKKRDSFNIAEAPMTLELPWAASPEMTHDRFGIAVDNEEGPHYGGFYSVNAWQRGVEFRRAQ